MAFCSGCGKEVADGTTYCPACGKPVGLAAGSGSGAAAAPAPIVTAQSGGLTDNVAGMLCYCPFLVGVVASVVFLVADPFKTKKFIRFHAFQSLFLHGAFIVLEVAFMVLNTALTAIFLPLAALAVMVEMLVWLGALVLVVMLMVKAYGNQSPHLPVIGELAEKQV